REAVTAAYGSTHVETVGSDVTPQFVIFPEYEHGWYPLLSYNTGYNEKQSRQPMAQHTWKLSALTSHLSLHISLPIAAQFTKHVLCYSTVE
ncbi:hypothetical protein J6590_104084, partial [Homalodisca vitripennis]